MFNGKMYQSCWSSVVNSPLRRFICHEMYDIVIDFYSRFIKYTTRCHGIPKVSYLDCLMWIWEMPLVHKGRVHLHTEVNTVCDLSYNLKNYRKLFHLVLRKVIFPKYLWLFCISKVWTVLLHRGMIAPLASKGVFAPLNGKRYVSTFVWQKVHYHI